MGYGNFLMLRRLLSFTALLYPSCIIVTCLHIFPLGGWGLSNAWIGAAST
jgi:hypothetical protein